MDCFKRAWRKIHRTLTSKRRKVTAEIESREEFIRRTMHLEGLSGSDSDGDTAMEAETGGLTRDEKVTILDLQSEELTNESKPSYDERTSWFENISLDSQEDTRHGEVLFDVEDELDRQRYVDKHRQFWRDWSAKHLGVVNDLSGGSEE